MRKLLLLLGAARYPHQPDLALPAFGPSHAAFQAVMLDGPKPIIDRDDCLDLFDTEKSWPYQQLEIHNWIQGKIKEDRKPDALIIYYVGHGGVGLGGEQVFLTINTTHQFDPYHSSIPRNSLAVLLRNSANILRKFLIIDCCFAAAVVQKMQSALQDRLTVELSEVGKVVNKPDGGGLAALCASSSIASADAGGRDGLTQFTDGFLSALRVGDPKSTADLSLESMRALIDLQLHERYGADAVAPSSYFPDDVYGPIHRLPLFPNRAERPLDVFRPRTDRPTPRARENADTPVQMATGNPSKADDALDNFLVMRPQFAASFNCERGRPNWVSWQFRYTDLGSAPREIRWRADPLLPEVARDLSPMLLSRTGFDRGHLCPPHNRSASGADMAVLFLSSNVVAQSPVRNQRLWQGFEQFCRELVKLAQCDLYIIAGPGGSLKRIADGRIDVPAVLWKLVLCVPEGHLPGPETRVAEVIAIRMTNHERAAITQWTESIVTVSSVEDETGYQFFTALPKEFANRLRRRQLTPRMAEMINQLVR